MNRDENRLFRPFGRMDGSGIGRREVALIVAAVTMLLAITIPYIYRQRIQYRRQICEARQFRLSLAIIQTSIDNRKLPGYRIIQAEDRYGVPQPSSWAYAILPYVHPIDVEILIPDAEPGAPQAIDQEWTYTRTSQIGPIATQGIYQDLYKRHGPDGETDERGRPPVHYVPEFICPASAPDSPSSSGAITSFVGNCGMPDVVPSTVPGDWPANGVFTDQFQSNYAIAAPMTLEYIENHDGLANVILISENVDAGKWTDTDEAMIGFVWTSMNTDAPSELVQDIWALNENAGLGKGEIQSARPSSYHISGFNVAFCNGSTRFIADSIDPIAWAWMMMSDSENPQYPGSDQLVGEPYFRERPPVPGGSLPRDDDDTANGDPENGDDQGNGSGSDSNNDAQNDDSDDSSTDDTDQQG